MTKIKIGEKSPDFELYDFTGKIVKLADFAGKKLVLYFYPKDDTKSCTIEAQEFTQLHSEFKKFNTEIYGISRDSIDSHRKFSEKYNLSVNLASDEGGKICSNFNNLREKQFFGVKNFSVDRTTFLINESGFIIQIWESVQALGHAKEVLEFVKSH